MRIDKMNEGNGEAIEAVVIELWRRSAETPDIREPMEYGVL